MSHDREGVGNGDVDVRRHPLRLLLPDELQQVVDDRLAASCLLLDEPQVIVELSSVLDVVDRELDTAQDAGQRVLDLMRDSGAELAERRHLLRLHELFIGGLELRLPLPQPVRHQIERFPEIPDLVGGLHPDPDVERAGPDESRGAREVFHRPGDAVGRDDADEVSRAGRRSAEEIGRHSVGVGDAGPEWEECLPQRRWIMAARTV